MSSRTNRNIIPWSEAIWYRGPTDCIYGQTCVTKPILTYPGVRIRFTTEVQSGRIWTRERATRPIDALSKSARVISIGLSSRRASNWNDFSLLSRITVRMRYHSLFPTLCRFAIFSRSYSLLPLRNRTKGIGETHAQLQGTYSEIRRAFLL